MIRVTVVPREEANLYGMLTAREVELRRSNRGTLHRSGKKKAGTERWTHKSYPGRITFQKCVGDTVAAVVQSRASDEEWQLLSSFVGFLDRNFRDDIGSINISYGLSED